MRSPRPPSPGRTIPPKAGRSIGTLNWANGDTRAKTFTIPISNATPCVGIKKFAVSISSATGATHGTPTSSVVTIAGDGSIPFGMKVHGANLETASSNRAPSMITLELARSVTELSVAFASV